MLISYSKLHYKIIRHWRKLFKKYRRRSCDRFSFETAKFTSCRTAVQYQYICYISVKKIIRVMVAPSSYPKRYDWPIVHRTSWYKHPRNLNQSRKLFFEENPFAYMICKCRHYVSGWMKWYRSRLALIQWQSVSTVMGWFQSSSRQ